MDTPKVKRKARLLLQYLGPGLITGASDDDPSGIATCSQAGAQFGLGTLWTLVGCLPLMIAIQEISARIGRVTGHGIAGNLRRHYPHWLLYLSVSVLLVANIINLGADIGAMGAALHLLMGGPMPLYSLGFAALSAWLLVVVPYSRYVGFLKTLCVALFAYVITAFVVGVPWHKVFHAIVHPPLTPSADAVRAIVAILGTMISPYLFFWQASAEVEEVKGSKTDEPLRKAPDQAQGAFERIRIDTYLGMTISSAVAFFVMLTAAVTLHPAGIHDIATADQAARALEPLAGRFASLLFAAGLIGTGLLAVPVLAGSAAYAVAETFAWPMGLERAPRRAKAFYSVIVVATLVGGLMNLVKFDSMKALFLAAVLNGVVAGPTMVLMLLMGRSAKVMGRFHLPAGLTLLGGIGAVVMIAASIAMFFLP